MGKGRKEKNLLPKKAAQGGGKSPTEKVAEEKIPKFF
jgi:hypothetical protein